MDVLNLLKSCGTVSVLPPLPPQMQQVMDLLLTPSSPLSSSSSTTITPTINKNIKKKRKSTHKKNKKRKVPALVRTPHQRLIWTAELEKRFLRALETHGVDTAMPKAILEFMKVPGLTRENVSSHLQKHRIRLAQQALKEQQKQTKEEEGSSLHDPSTLPLSPSACMPELISCSVSPSPTENIFFDFVSDDNTDATTQQQQPFQFFDSMLAYDQLLGSSAAASSSASQIPSSTPCLSSSTSFSYAPCFLLPLSSPRTSFSAPSSTTTTTPSSCRGSFSFSDFAFSESLGCWASF